MGYEGIRGSGYSSLPLFELLLNILRIISIRWLLKFQSHKQVLILVNKLFLIQEHIFIFFKRKTANCFYLTGKYILPLWASRSQKVVILSPGLVCEKWDTHLVVSSYQQHSNQHYISSKTHHFMLFLKIIRVPFCCK